MKEKRSHKRQAKSAAAVLRFEVQGEFKTGAAGKTGLITDLGPDGVGLLTDENLELGQILKFPGTRNRREFAESGQVIWTAESQEGFRVGVKFL
jgi:hypothetical protein